MTLRQKLEILLDSIPPTDPLLSELIAQVEQHFVRSAELERGSTRIKLRAATYS